MAKNSQPRPPKQQTPAMSPSHPHTVGAAAGLSVTPNLPSADDDEDHICPICDGDCTCSKLQAAPSTKSLGSVRNVATSTTLNTPQAPSLKIKLTVPPGMLGKRRASASTKYKKSGEVIAGMLNKGEVFSIPSPWSPPFLPHHSQGSSVPKRRGRPPKSMITVRKPGSTAFTDSGNEANPLSDRSTLSRSQRPGAPSSIKPGAQSGSSLTSRARAMTVKKPTASKTKKRRVVLSDSDLLSDDDDDAHSTQFLTFVSASSTASEHDSDTSSSSGFDSDSSIVAEEENFILTEERRAHDKARLRRELIGDEGRQSKRERYDNWVIQPRKNSVGPTGMDVDSNDDAMEDEDDEQEEESEEESEDAEDEVDEGGLGSGYAGVATGWSDDESSFDADLFFANLSDSDSDALSSMEDSDCHVDVVARVEGAVARRHLDNLPLEVTEGWDGQITFTSGLEDGQAILDHDFELSASQASNISQMHNSDVEMQTSDGADVEDEDDDESDGATTEEELVGPNGLPTERAMKLFRLPTSISAINPLSTLSPAASPRPLNRRRALSGPLTSPTPADILSGKAFFDDSDEQDGSIVGTRSVTSSKCGGPIMGQFQAEEGIAQRCAVITGSNKDVPSPFPRLRRDIKHSRHRSGLGSGSGLDFRELFISRRSSLSLPGSSQSPFQILSPEELTTTTSDELPPADPIDLDDVLDSSFLDSDREDVRLASAMSSEHTGEHVSNLNRWDVISVGAFRQTREPTGMTSDSASASWNCDGSGDTYESMLKTNPLTTMMWNNKGSNTPKRGPKPNINLDISPVLLPLLDGDRTPTNNPPSPIPQTSPGSDSFQKTRKEIRREKKIKRRGPGLARNQHQHHSQYNHHHHHSHYPNMKSRSSSSMQRTNFFGSTSGVPPLNL